MSLRFFVYLLLLLSVVIFGYRKFNLLSKEFKILVIYVTYVLISEITSKYFSYYQGNNMVLFHILVPIQLFFYSIFYPLALKKWSIPITIVSFTFIICSILNTIYVQSINGFPTNNIILSSLLAIPLSLLQFRELALSRQITLLHKNPLFWFNLGNITFNTLTFFSFGYFNLFDKNIPEWLFIIIWTLNMTFYGCCFYAIKLDAFLGLKQNKKR